MGCAGQFFYWLYNGMYKKESPQLVSATNQLKLKAADGKLRLTDTLDAQSVKSNLIFQIGISSLEVF